MTKIEKELGKQKKLPKQDYPRDMNWELYQNIDNKWKRGITKKIRKSTDAATVKRSWDNIQWIESTEKINMKRRDEEFKPIPEHEVRMLVQQIREWVSRRVAVRALWRWETRAEYYINNWLKYTDKVMDGDNIIERPTYVKDEIAKAEAEQEKMARLSLMQSMKKWNAKVALEFLNKQQEEINKYFNDREEYRQLAKDMGLSQKEYYRCLNVLNGMSEQKASENVWFHKSLNMYHYRMNPQVKEFIKVVKIHRRQELMDWIDFTKETAQAAMTYALWILMDEFQKNDNTKQDKINIAKEIRNTAESIWKATALYPKDDVQPITNIAVLASENTDKVLEMLWQKHETKALNITKFTNDTKSTNWGTTQWTEDAVQNESA